MDKDFTQKFDQEGAFLVKYDNPNSKYHGSIVWLIGYEMVKIFPHDHLEKPHFKIKADGMPKKSGVWSHALLETNATEEDVKITETEFKTPKDMLGRDIDIGDFIHHVNKSDSVIGKVKGFTAKGGIKTSVIAHTRECRRVDKKSYTVNVNRVNEVLILDPDSEAITYAALTN